MNSEPRSTWRTDLRWRVGALVLMVVLLVGAACTAWTLHGLQQVQTSAAREDAEAIAQSVAQTLAQQLARAVRLGIPLTELPGLEAYFQAALKNQPTLTAISVRLADGDILQTVGAHGGGAGAGNRVRVPIAGPGPGRDAGEVWVSAGGSELASFRQARRNSWLATLALALLAALLAALTVGRRLEQQRRLIWQQLNDRGANQPLHRDSVGIIVAHGPLATLHAVARGASELAATQQALHAYAHELLAVDFDGQMRPRIERILQQANSLLPEAD